MSVALDPLRSALAPARSASASLVSRLRDSFDAGYTRGLDWRREQLLRLRSMLRNHRDELANALRLDLGKPELEAAGGELAQAALEASFALKNLRRWTRPERIGPLSMPGRRQVLHDPLGVVLIMSPWSYPVGRLLTPLVGAIAAGNCAVLRPSEVADQTSSVLGRLVTRYLDSSAIALVQGGVEQTMELLEQRFDHIYYSGGGAMGRLTMQAAARHLTPVTIELVGKSPCIVDAEVDIREAARRIAWGKFLFAGQTNAAPDYVLVHERREREFVRELGAAITEFLGPEPTKSPNYARIANPQRYARLTAMLADGEVAIGGEAQRDTCTIAPTVLRRVSPDAPIMTAEVFGPILPVFCVRGMTEAIDFVNDRDDPLAVYVFSEDLDVQESVLERARSGAVCVNGIPQLADRAFPFGDVGASGVGAHHGRLAFDNFSQRVTVLNRGRRFESKWLYPSYNRLKTRLVERML